MAYVTKQDNLLPQQQGVGFSVFDENDPRYRCCCGGKCHSRTGAMIIAVLSLLSVIGEVINEVYKYVTKNNKAEGAFIGLICSIIGFVISLAIVLMLIHGIRKERPGFMIPYMVCQILSIILLIVLAVLSILALSSVFVLAMFSEDNEKKAYSGDMEYYDRHNLTKQTKSASMLLAGISLGIFALAIALQIWFFMVILKCYRYVRDKRAVFVPAGQHY